jgi:hypothetical protein
MTESKPSINDQFFDAELPVEQCIKIALREVSEISDFRAGIIKHFLEMALRQLEREVEGEKQH